MYYNNSFRFSVFARRARGQGKRPAAQRNTRERGLRRRRGHRRIGNVAVGWLFKNFVWTSGKKVGSLWIEQSSDTESLFPRKNSVTLPCDATRSAAMVFSLNAEGPNGRVRTCASVRLDVVLKI